MKTAQRSWFAEIPPRAVRVLAVNGFLTKQGKGVFGGKGILYACKKLYPGIENNWGAALKRQERPVGHTAFDSGRGNHVALIYEQPPILALPIKWLWFENADMQLIERSLSELVRVADKLEIPELYLHPFSDGVPWDDVKATLKRYLDDRFVLCYGD